MWGDVTQLKHCPTTTHVLLTKRRNLVGLLHVIGYREPECKKCKQRRHTTTGRWSLKVERMSDREPLLKDQPLPQASAPPSGHVFPPPEYKPPPYYSSGGPPYQAGAVYQPPTQVVINQCDHFSSVPIQLRCSYCQTDVITTTTYKSGLLIWGCIAVLCLFGLFIPFLWCIFWIPLFISDLKDVEHSCPNCGRVCGIYKRLG